MKIYSKKKSREFFGKIFVCEAFLKKKKPLGNANDINTGSYISSFKLDRPVRYGCDKCMTES